MIIDHLEQAERHVRQGAVHLQNQRALIERLETGGHDTKESRRLLQQFEEMQALHVGDRDRLRETLAQSDLDMIRD